MATTITSAVALNDTDARFRAWAQFVHDVLSNGGWVQTADSGQIDLTTALKPGATNTKVGYEIWGMSDSLQSTAPIYLKIAYGSGASNSNTIGLWFAIGTGTDGAGNLVDPADGTTPAYLIDQYSQVTAAMLTTGSSGTTRACFGSADTDRAVFLLFEAQPTLAGSGSPCVWNENTSDYAGVETSNPLLFSIERARDYSGVVLDTHIFLMWTAITTRLAKHILVETDLKWLPLSVLAGPAYVMPAAQNNFGADANASRLATGTKYATSPIPFRRNTFPMAPGINVMLSRSPLFEFDISACIASTPYITGRTASLDTLDGATRTYRTCAGIRAGSWTDSGLDAGAFTWILYE
jgi:hypothetical protein